ncbi:DNA-directed RNA polymerase subunit omega [bacterium]|nr:DNA-directed RNA polymerase subunit omega [bacterium]
MKREEESLINPPLEDLIARIPDKYELVLLATRRAKQIIRERRLSQMGERGSTKQRKPLSIALEEIAAGKLELQALMAPDIEFDKFEGQPVDQFDELVAGVQLPAVKGKGLMDEPDEGASVDLDEENDEENDEKLDETGDKGKAPGSSSH